MQFYDQRSSKSAIVGADEQQLLRVVRLEALLYLRPRVGVERAGMRRAFDSAIWNVAREADNVIGLVGQRTRICTRHVESIWVIPTHRRHGVSSALLQALVEMERRVG